MKTVQKLNDTLQTISHSGRAQYPIYVRINGQSFEIKDINVIDAEENKVEITIKH